MKIKRQNGSEIEAERIVLTLCADGKVGLSIMELEVVARDGSVFTIEVSEIDEPREQLVIEEERPPLPTLKEYQREQEAARLAEYKKWRSDPAY